MTKHIVTEADFDERAEFLRKHVNDSLTTCPATGVFGPHSLTWRYGKEWCLFWASARTLMMQEAHPIIGKALNDYSNVEEDPLGRWRRSFEYVNTMCFSDLDTALSKAKDLWRIHSHITGTMPDGTPYSANQEDALLWVAGSMFDAIDIMYDMTYGKRPLDEKYRHYDEFRLFAYMFGISKDVLPNNYLDFKNYINYNVKSGQLQIDEQTKNRFWFFANKFLHGPLREFKPFAENYISFTSGILPKEVREQYGLTWDLTDKISYAKTRTALRTLYPLLPKKFRENIYYKQHVRGLYV